jgi:hypothetical protein
MLAAGPAIVSRGAAATSGLDIYLGTGSNAAFGKLIGMGSGPAAAACRTTTITLPELQAMGMTLPVAQHWLHFYQNAVANGTGGLAASERVLFFQRCSELLKNKSGGARHYLKAGAAYEW